MTRPAESGGVIMTKPPEYQEDPTTSMSPEDKALTDRLMAQIIEKPEPKNLQEAVPKIEEKIPQEAIKPKSAWNWTSEDINNFIKNFFAKIKTSFKNLFR